MKINRSNPTLLEELAIALILMLVIFVITPSTCQAPTRDQKKKLYLTWLEQKRGLKIKGVLYQVKDSSVVISNSRNPQEYQYVVKK